MDEEKKERSIELRVQRVATPSGRVGWTLTRGNGRPVEPVERFLRYRFHGEASPNTLKAYAHDLKLFFGFLHEQGLEWASLTAAGPRHFSHPSRL